MTLQQSWTKTLRIWIDRFAEAQKAIRELEAENVVLKARLAIAVDILTPAQTTEMFIRVGVSSEAQPHVGEVSGPSQG